MTQLAKRCEQKAIAPQWPSATLRPDYAYELASATQMNGCSWPLAVTDLDLL